MATALPTRPKKIGAARVIAGIVLFVALLLIAWAVHGHAHQSPGPTPSTNHSYLNVQKKSPAETH